MKPPRCALRHCRDHRPFDRAGGGAGLPVQADQAHRADRGRRHRRHHRAPDAAEAQRSRRHHRGREPARRRRRHRHQRSRQGAGRRLHVPGRQPRRAGDAAASAEDSVRSVQELRAGLPCGHGAQHSGGASVGAGEIGEGADRLRQGQPGQADLCIARRRRVGSHRRRAVQAARRRRHHACALQGRGAGGAGSRRRPCQHDVRRGVAGARADPAPDACVRSAWRPSSASPCCRTCRP